MNHLLSSKRFSSTIVLNKPSEVQNEGNQVLVCPYFRSSKILHIDMPHAHPSTLQLQLRLYTIRHFAHLSTLSITMRKHGCSHLVSNYLPIVHGALFSPEMLLNTNVQNTPVSQWSFPFKSSMAR